MSKKAASRPKKSRILIITFTLKHNSLNLDADRMTFAF